VTSWRLAAAIASIAILHSGAAQAFSENEAMAALVAAYPDALLKYEGRALHWRDGTITEAPPDEIKSFDQTLRGASLLDQLRIPYPRGTLEAPPPVNEDPGRFRNLAFFRKMYGNCWRGEVTAKLVPVIWLPKTWNYMIRATSVNGVAKKLMAISNEIEQLPPKIRRAAYPIGGAYACRTIADTAQPSMHSYGAAIDMNISMADYWYWRRSSGGALTYRNRMPNELVEIFERNGFIWGGKWYHYDTMHFEYRPELLELAKRR
jgi:D-alanyl-D-alanine carboxypeptidase-like protein